MRKPSLSKLFLPIFLLSAGYAQALEFHSTQINVEVKPESNAYVKKVLTRGVFNPKDETKIIFGELEKVRKLRIDYLDKGKWKKLSKRNVTETSVNGPHFYGGFRSINISFPMNRPMKFKIRFEIIGKELLFLSQFPNGQDYQESSQLLYSVAVPNTHTLSYAESDIDNTMSYEIRENQDAQKVHHFESKFNSFSDRQPIRMLIHSILETPTEAFNNWFINKNHTETNSPELNLVSSKLTNDCRTDLEKIRTIFSYVQNSIKYTSMVNGVFALETKNPTIVLEQKKGDCKDINTLLVSLLNHSGIQAFPALTATHDHPYSMNFPSLASTNHMIAYVATPTDTLFLDATQSAVAFPHPSTYTQGEQILVLREKPSYQIIPVTQAKHNQIKYELIGKIVDTDFQGRAHLNFTGLTQHIFNLDQNEDQIIEKLSTWWPSIKIGNPQVSATLEGIEINLEVNFKNAISKIENRNYLNPNLLPSVNFLLENDNDLGTLLSGINFGYACSINLDTGCADVTDFNERRNKVINQATEIDSDLKISSSKLSYAILLKADDFYSRPVALTFTEKKLINEVSNREISW